MKQKNKDYLFYSTTTSLCPECLKKVPAKIIIKDNSVFMKKRCKEHGVSEVLIEDDANYYLNKYKYDKPGTICKTQTMIDRGCPFDCGLCPDHEQHTCIGLLEVTNNCDLTCPICYANSGEGDFMSLETIHKILDNYQDSEYGNAEILQISGGEPTTHPQILEIIKIAKNKKIKYVMLNTNGIRISKDLEFVKKLSELKGGFEIYLQFDGFDEKTSIKLRGKNILDIKKKAIENLSKYGIPITLVSTIKKGLNDDEMGEIIDFGLKTKYIRGINFQPVTYFGRYKKEDKYSKMTNTGIYKKIEKQTGGMIKFDDFIPLPCTIDNTGVTFLYKNKGEFIPITRNMDVKKHLKLIKNTFDFDAKEMLTEAAKGLCGGNSCGCFDFIKDVKTIIPLSFIAKPQKEKTKFIDENTFRISIVSFIDAYNFDIKSVKKECVHILTPDLKKMPFSMYNLLYRDNNNNNNKDGINVLN
ncbi:radical SAM protein [archaeon]|jgi:7,8-dihydro-6-hydroxymethylpterin dimethyltransferase|nr:radical SAM protein [archaeon]MBT4351433.1 radical SAM protein [archaeon]MBT4647276.1 radical SAM protein [archaeon]MBT6821161.1 radical SAM protein [archaeon]MBT7391671.1 radical SAM protein [archaeon]